MNTVIFDIDGTLADVTHRRALVECEKPDWKAFNGAIGADTPHHTVVRLLWQLQWAGNKIVLCSGRDGQYRQLTEYWMLRNDIQYDALFMRSVGDRRKDHIIKVELLADIRAAGFNPWLVVDDRDSVVAMWREQGLTCLQCAPGNF